MGLKSRVFFIMQYEKHPETGEELLSEEQIKDALNHRTIKRWAYVCHDKDVFSEADELNDPAKKQGECKPRHWHIALEMGSNQAELGVIAKWFKIPTNFVDIAKGRGAFLDCVKYLTHEDEKQQEHGKHRYDDSEIKANFDFRAEIMKKAERRLKFGRDLSDIEAMKADVLYNGKTLRECQEEDKFLYMENIDRLKKFRLEYISNMKPPVTRINYYVCGRGGVGKGLICRALARSLFPQYSNDEDIFFEVGAKGAAFEGYDGQPVIIWNDRRAIDLLTELNGRGNVFNVFDTHPTRQKQNVKYGSINLCNVVNIVNSVQPYSEFLDGLAGEYKDKDGNLQSVEDKGQSYRRFPLMIVLHESDFDLLLNKGFMENTSDFEEYIQYTGIRGNMQKIAEKCRGNEELARKIEAKTLKPVVDKHQELVDKLKDDEVNEDDIMKEFEQYGDITSVIDLKKDGTSQYIEEPF